MPEPAQPIERKLAAIFAADVAGYSRLMGQDEVGTLRTLAAHREIMDRLIGEHGGLDRATERLLDRLAEAEDPTAVLASLRRRRMKPGTELMRHWGGTTHRVVVTEGGYAYAGETYSSLSEIARLITGTNWNGPRFFGLRQEKRPDGPATIVPTNGKRGRPSGRPRSDRVEHQAGGVS